MVFQLTKKEAELRQCALMILRDECPPERGHYLCMEGEDYTALDCTKCWDRYLRGVAAGTIQMPKTRRKAL